MQIVSAAAAVYVCCCSSFQFHQQQLKVLNAKPKVKLDGTPKCMHDNLAILFHL